MRINKRCCLFIHIVFFCCFTVIMVSSEPLDGYYEEDINGPTYSMKTGQKLQIFRSKSEEYYKEKYKKMKEKRGQELLKKVESPIGTKRIISFELKKSNSCPNFCLKREEV